MQRMKLLREQLQNFNCEPPIAIESLAMLFVRNHRRI